MKLHISAKCSDCCSVAVENDQGQYIVDKHGYVPHDMGVGGGDYLEFIVDVETGKIVNWNSEKVKVAVAEQVDATG